MTNTIEIIIALLPQSFIVLSKAWLAVVQYKEKKRLLKIFLIFFPFQKQR